MAACVFNSQIYLFWRADSNANIYVSSSANNAWPSGKSVNSGETTSMAPAVCLYQNYILLFYTANDSGHLVLWGASSSGTSWPQNAIVNGAISSSAAVSVANFNSDAYVFWKDGNGKLCFSPSNP